MSASHYVGYVVLVNEKLMDTHTKFDDLVIEAAGRRINIQSAFGQCEVKRVICGACGLPKPVVGNGVS